MKYKICYIDDLSYGIPQVIHAIPKDVEYEFFYYSRISEIEDIKFDIVVLDFYLDKDKKTALDVVDRFLESIIISFSSAASKNELMLRNWADYQAWKLSKININSELENIFKKIFIKKIGI